MHQPAKSTNINNDHSEKSKVASQKLSLPNVNGTKNKTSSNKHRIGVMTLNNEKANLAAKNEHAHRTSVVSHSAKKSDDGNFEERMRTTSSQRKAFVRIHDYGVTAEQGTRRTMEDQHVMLSEGVPFFGVYDGHGGTQCAEYLRDNLHRFIFDDANFKQNPQKAVSDGIMKADEEFLKLSQAETNESGSVCAVALLVDDVLIVGNVGDCEAVLSRNGAPIVLTVKHNLQSNPSEVERIKALGGKIFHNRVGHPKFNPSVVSLAVTRAIGDAGFKLEEYTEGKESGVISTPHISSTKLTSSDEFFVIACDGLWDVMSYAEVIEFCHHRFEQELPSQVVAEELAQKALKKGSTDNVTAMLIRLTRREKNDKSSVGIVPLAAISNSHKQNSNSSNR